ncbi:DUF1848 domain-containing protein [Anaerosalibacter bizertensis]|uniref:DUF1848 domain-containing protein n=1 Tax=Anaerosalibacter bizertensis TaxID=932217 RepID=A0A9Q4FMK8_9FIRM|nr:DUF1848 domain-containing protein [Anaerosalibacter bizertensis]MBV1820519.1 DUF1848 domain-containing protein [Bacteroidales bacterium MSK.15.36]MCG4566033.1 DUF1848 domain-containing protein [Anaerosalibacter bizertensis]MCG4583464.1 DUF1848 domain-containing protein [Anaerosalibacter bizertensis]
MGFKSWDKVNIETVEGEKTGIAPIIISASRSTDIPAFYSEWFFNRLDEGYVKWINPFNRKPQYVSFENARVIVFWTKNAKIMIDKLDELDKRNINYYFQYTLNDYEKEGFEKNVPALEYRIETFKELSEKIGKGKAIWRFDPLILTESLDVDDLLCKIKKVGDEIHSFTEKLVFSFADISVYSRVCRNLKKQGIKYIEFDADNMKKIAEGLNDINKNWGLEIATCSEEVDLTDYNVKKNKCIDDELMINQFSEDKTLMDFLGCSSTQLSLFDQKPKKKNNLKDKGQRKTCGCIVSKDIGQYNTCNHKCIYCYANYSEKITEKNYFKYQNSHKNNESILL